MATLNLQTNLVVASVMVVCLWASQALARPLESDTTARSHEMWMAQYGRVYKDNAEKVMRRKIFEDNVAFIESFNQAGKKSYKLGINQFADLTDEEFRASRNGFKASWSWSKKPTTAFKYENVSGVPVSMDWRTEGAVTPEIVYAATDFL